MKEKISGNSLLNFILNYVKYFTNKQMKKLLILFIVTAVTTICIFSCSTSTENKEATVSNDSISSDTAIVVKDSLIAKKDTTKK